ncbi:hypothetical protein [Melittangium boletus]|uniref:Lipoprotein n=1 Tax=Melittangium boletus DSM 14713 TaxID=1294270 RepID=A0A250I9R5_9BACT|nr:hypothetical protein [Melittangium boletus]ATB28614.1 hypothetical protein MEBOL_002063 [Melittangium boletus DSM 14713]
MHRSRYPTLLLCTALALSAQAQDTTSQKTLLGERVTREEFGAFQSHLARLTSPTGESDPPDAMSKVSRWYQPAQYMRGHGLEPASRAQLQKALARTRELVMRNAYEQLQLEASFAPLLNLEGVTPEVRILSLKDGQGRPVSFTPRPSSPIEGGRLLSSLVLAQDTGTKGFPTWSGSAEVVLSVPSGHARVRFDAKDAGQTKSGFTLLAWGARVQLRYTPVPGQDITFLAHADNGLALAPIKTSRLPLAEWELARKVSTMKWEDVPEQVDAPEEEGPVVLTWDYSAPPARLDVFVPGKPVKYTVKMKLVPAAEDSHPEPPDETAVAPRWCGLDAPALTQALRVEASRARGDAFGTPVLFVQLPACDEGAFSEVQFNDVKFLTAAGEALSEVQLREEGFQHASFSVPVSFGPAQSTSSTDASFRRLARVRGDVQVRWPRVRVVELTPVASRSEGVRATFAGKKLTLEQDMAMGAKLLASVGGTPDWLRENPLVTDAEGRILLGERGRTTEGKTSTKQEYLFDVPPVRVRLLYASEVLHVTVPFDVTFPPPPELRDSIH